MIIEIHWLAVFVSAVAGFAVGTIWYMPAVFGNAWMAALGKTPEQLGSPARALSITALTTLLSALVLALVLGAFEVQTITGSAVISLMLATGIYGLTFYSDSLFCGWNFKLVIIQASYRIVMFTVIGVVLSLFNQ